MRFISWVRCQIRSTSARIGSISRGPRARTAGIDFLFVTSGIHAEELGGRERPDGAALKSVFAAAGEMPKAVMRELVW